MRTVASLQIGPVTSDDVTRVRETVELSIEQPFVRERQHRNVSGPPPVFTPDRFWYVLVGCLLTTQQRSTRGTPVKRFMNLQSFPLALSQCRETRMAEWIENEIKSFGGIRRGPTIARQAVENWRKLQAGEWRCAEQTFRALLEQRKRPPIPSDKDGERNAAKWAEDMFAGLGPKQARNLWQWLGLTRYEIPLDSRIAKWAEQNLSVEIERSRLSKAVYYEAVLDYIQALCNAAEVLPCVFDAVAFRYDDPQSSEPAEGATAKAM